MSASSIMTIILHSMLSLGKASGFASGFLNAACGMTVLPIRHGQGELEGPVLTSRPITGVGVEIQENEQLVWMLLTEPDPFVVLVMPQHICLCNVTGTSMKVRTGHIVQV